MDDDALISLRIVADTSTLTTNLKQAEDATLASAAKIENAVISSEERKTAAIIGSVESQKIALVEAQAAQTAALAKQATATQAAVDAKIIAAESGAKANAAIAAVENDVIMAYAAKRAGRIGEIRELETSHAANSAKAQVLIAEAAEDQKTARSLQGAAARTGSDVKKTAQDVAHYEKQVAIAAAAEEATLTGTRLAAERRIAVRATESLAFAANAEAKVIAAQAAEEKHTLLVAAQTEKRVLIAQVGETAYAAAVGAGADGKVAKKAQQAAAEMAVTRNAAATEQAVVTAAYQQELITVIANRAGMTQAVIAGEQAATAAIVAQLPIREAALLAGVAAQQAAAEAGASAQVAAQAGVTAAIATMMHAQTAAVVLSYEEQLAAAIKTQTGVTAGVAAGQAAQVEAVAAGQTLQAQAYAVGIATKTVALEAGASEEIAIKVGLNAALKVLTQKQTESVVLSYEQQLAAAASAVAAQTAAVVAGVEARTAAIKAGATQQAAAIAAGVAAQREAITFGAAPLEAQALGLAAVRKAMSEFSKQASETGAVTVTWFGRIAESFLRTGVQANTLDSQLVHVFRALGGLQNLSLSGIATIGSNLGLLAIGLASVAFGVTVAVAALKVFADQAEKMTGVSHAFETLTDRVGGTARAFTETLHPASMGLISDLNLMKATNEAVLLGIPVTADKMGQLIEGAVLLGKSMGVDALKSVNSLIEGIGRQSPRLLDNIGIVVRAKEVYSEYAKSIGVSADELTDEDRKAAFLAATLESITEKTRNLIPENKTLADSIHQVWIEIANATSGAIKYVNVLFGESRLEAEVNRINETSVAYTEEAKSVDKVTEAIRKLNQQKIDAQNRRVIQSGGTADLPGEQDKPYADKSGAERVLEKQMLFLGKARLPGLASAGELVESFKATDFTWLEDIAAKLKYSFAQVGLPGLSNLGQLAESTGMFASKAEDAATQQGKMNIALRDLVTTADNAEKEVAALSKTYFDFKIEDVTGRMFAKQQAIDSDIDKFILGFKKKDDKLDEVGRRLQDQTTPREDINALLALQKQLTPRPEKDQDSKIERRLNDEAKFQEMLDQQKIKAEQKFTERSEELQRIALEHKYKNDIDAAHRRLEDTGNLEKARDIAIEENHEKNVRERAQNEISIRQITNGAITRGFKQSQDQINANAIEALKIRADSEVESAHDNNPKILAIRQALESDILNIQKKSLAAQHVAEIENALKTFEFRQNLKEKENQSKLSTAQAAIDPNIKPGEERDAIATAKSDDIYALEHDQHLITWATDMTAAKAHFEEMGLTESVYEDQSYFNLLEYLQKRYLAKVKFDAAELKSTEDKFAREGLLAKAAHDLELAQAGTLVGAIGSFAQAAIKNKKKAAISAVIISTAQGVMKAYEEGPILGSILAALVIATGALQIQKINSADSGGGVGAAGTPVGIDYSRAGTTNNSVGTGPTNTLGVGASRTVGANQPYPAGQDPNAPRPPAPRPPTPVAPPSVVHFPGPNTPPPELTTAQGGTVAPPSAVRATAPAARPPEAVTAQGGSVAPSSAVRGTAPVSPPPAAPQAPASVAPSVLPPPLPPPPPIQPLPPRSTESTYNFTIQAVDAKSFRGFLEDPENRRSVAEAYSDHMGRR